MTVDMRTGRSTQRGRRIPSHSSRSTGETLLCEMAAVPRATQRGSPSAHSPSGWAVTSGRSSPEARPSRLSPNTSRRSRVSRSIVLHSLTSSASDAPRWDWSSRPGSPGTLQPCEAFCAWDPVLRSLLDGRPVYQPDSVPLRSSDGSPLELDQRFRLGERDRGGGAFPGRDRISAPPRRLYRSRDRRGRRRSCPRRWRGPDRGRFVLVGDDPKRRALSLPDPRLRTQVTSTSSPYRG